jgi:methylenetetrahydrofolate reductase (NADPH)
MNGTRTPDALLARIEAAAPDDQLAIAVDAATALCRRLLDGGAPGIHLYTLNRSDAARHICRALDGFPAPPNLSAT